MITVGARSLAISLRKDPSVGVHLGSNSTRTKSPAPGKIFWTDWGRRAAIESASMTGENRKSIITSNIQWPNAITVDYSGNRIFWVDAKTKRVEGADLDGGNRMILQSTDLVHPFGATIYGDEIFWTDWGRSSVEAVNKDGTNRRTVFSGIKQPMNIYSLETQTGVGACSVSPCRDGICLAVNETDYQCYCDRYVTPDPTTGSCDPAPLLFLSNRNGISNINLNGGPETRETLINKYQARGEALDWDLQEGRMYFAYNNVIYSVKTDGTELTNLTMIAHLLQWYLKCVSNDLT
eukprot:sb/3467563/